MQVSFRSDNNNVSDKNVEKFKHFFFFENRAVNNTTWEIL